MTPRRMFVHALAVTALGGMCLAQSMGSQGSNNQEGGSNPTSMSSQTSSSSSSSSGMKKSPDQAFVMKAAEGGMAEVEMGNLAKQNASNDSVKQFGDKMVTDHSKANDELKQLAQQKGITIPSDTDKKHKMKAQMMQKKQGAEFDKAYVSDMVKDHEKDVAEFRKEANSGKDPEVKAWAQKTLPVLEQHLSQVKQLAQQMGVSTASSMNSPNSMGADQSGTANSGRIPNSATQPNSSMGSNPNSQTSPTMSNPQQR